MRRTGAAQSPVASFTYSPSIPTPGQTVVFDASSSHDLYGTIVTYAWDFGDGSTAILTNSTATHSYPLDGTYTVQLTVTDDSGSTNVAVAVVEVNCVVFFRVTQVSSQAPIANVQVTAYTNETGTWTKTPVSSNAFEIKYDNMTQPNLANTNAQRYRNPGYTASILLSNASNIGFDSHQGDWYVYFSFTFGVWSAKWPNNATYVYTYEHGTVETHQYWPGDGPVWDNAAGTYVIPANEIADQGVAPTQDHPILVTISCPTGPQQYYLTIKTAPAA